MATSTAGGFVATLVRGLIGKAVAFVVGLAVLAGVTYFFLRSEAAAAPDVGTCVNVTGSIADADTEELPCSDPTATYVVRADKGTCDETELTYEIRVGRGNGAKAVGLCLDLNAKKGDCFEIEMISADSKIDCAEATGSSSVRVLATRDSADGPCPKATVDRRANTTRDTLICLGSAG
ncbi:hypothetical protein GCM10009788_35650 [Nocardioides humi]|uniref:Uncharacterized protein n=1 Tax=Nocardioides humi TaxID=449461 RepID=A0ABN2AWV6_9ACTN